MFNKPKILLAEDDLNLGVLLTDYLETEGFEVKLCTNGERALEVFQSASFDLCLLDVMMPKLDGFSVAKAVRKDNPEIPIVFITAKSLKEDKVNGFELGADDYIVKPFDEELLLYKIKALLRRSNTGQETGPAQFQIGQFTFDVENQALTINGDTKRITEKECDILRYFCQHPNKVIKREDLLKDLWGENDYFLGRSLDVFISKLRKYLSADPQLSIETVFGVGFVFKC